MNIIVRLFALTKNLQGYNMKFVTLLVLGIISASTAITISYFKVPNYGSPLSTSTVTCRYQLDRSDPPLYTLEIYLGNHQIFKYTPSNEDPIQTFNGSAGACFHNSTCSVGVPLPEARGRGLALPVKCVATTDKPKFAVVKQTKYLTVAVPLDSDPVISVQTEASEGELALVVSCTAAAWPRARLTLLLEGRPAAWSPAAAAGGGRARASWAALRLPAAARCGCRRLQCRAAQDSRPPVVRLASVTVVRFKSTDSSEAHQTYWKETGGLILAIALGISLFFIFKKYHLFRFCYLPRAARSNGDGEPQDVPLTWL